MLQDLLLISTAFCVAFVIFLLSENLDLHKKQREMQKQIDTLKKEIEPKTVLPISEHEYQVGATPTIPNHITIKEMTNNGGFYKTEQQYS